MQQPLIQRVARVLDAQSISYALIGAAALAVYGYARSTSDTDLITTDTTVFTRDWKSLLPEVSASVTKGDFDDPLAGVVRFESPSREDVDLVVGRWKWQRDAISRAVRRDIGGTALPVVTLVDLVLFKLDAGGPLDFSDIMQLIEIHGLSLIDDVDNLLPDVERLRGSWNEFRQRIEKR